MRNPLDNCVHFSELHEFSKSAAHYRHACEHKRMPSQDMLIGSIFDALVLGYRKVVVYPGKVRNGREWEAFRDEHRDSIVCIASEYDRAIWAAKAVQRDPVAAPYLGTGTKQVIMKWEIDGVPCASGIAGERGGFDLLGPDWIRDLKLTATTEPAALERQIVRMGWHEQQVFYRYGARAAGRTVSSLGVIAVEQRLPHNVTCMRFSDALVELGERAVRSYLEKYKACEASGHWPGYAQTELVADVPGWIAVGDDTEEDES